MAFLAIPKSRLLGSSATTLRLAGPRLTAGFHHSPIRGVLRETDRHRDNMDKEIEEQSRDSLQRHKEGRPHWRESLASVSEAGIKADRDETQDPAEVEAMKKEMERGAKYREKVYENEQADKRTEMDR